MKITVVIPSLPSRAAMLDRALKSVYNQTLQPWAIIEEYDSSTPRQGAAAVRHRGLLAVKTDWVAFLDDDDEFKPEHLSELSKAAQRHDADFVYSWYDVVGGTDPRPKEFGLVWDPEKPRQTTSIVLVKTDLAIEVGGFSGVEYQPGQQYGGEDWLFTQRVNSAGGRIYHLPKRTWRWHHHGSNTSGLPTR